LLSTQGNFDCPIFSSPDSIGAGEEVYNVRLAHHKRRTHHDPHHPRVGHCPCDYP
jgi:hypothetical protein